MELLKFLLTMLFCQLFTVFVRHTDHSFSVTYALVTWKTTALYQGVFDKLHELLPDFQPNQVIADFEGAPATAIRTVFGNAATVSGCFVSFIIPRHWDYATFFEWHCSTRSSVSEIRLSTTSEVHCLAFHTCLFPRLPVLQFVAAFSSLAFLVPRFVTVGSASGRASEAMCRWFAYGPADVTASKNPAIFCLN